MTRAERQAHTVRDLLAAAEAEFSARGYAAVTVDSIAERAGYTRGAVYGNFPAGKPDLFLQVAETRAARYVDEINAALATADGEAIAEVYLGVRSRARSTPGWGRALVEFGLVAADDGSLRERFAALRRATVDRVRSGFEDLFRSAPRRRSTPAISPRSSWRSKQGSTCSDGSTPPWSTTISSTASSGASVVGRTPRTRPDSGLPAMRKTPFALHSRWGGPPGMQRKRGVSGRSAFADGAVDEQGDDGADHRADEPGRLERSFVEVGVEQQVAEKAADEGADDAQQDGAADAHRVAAGHEEPGEEAGDDADEEQVEDEADHAEFLRNVGWSPGWSDAVRTRCLAQGVRVADVGVCPDPEAVKPR
jgi:AcrR family transcriptional regulator